MKRVVSHRAFSPAYLETSSHCMNRAKINLIDAHIKRSGNQIIIHINDDHYLNIPEHQQIRLSDHIEQEVFLGIRPEFISMAKESDKLNTISAKLVSDYKFNGHYYQRFAIGDQQIVTKENWQISQHDIGKDYALNFDTFFSHIFDKCTQMNLTL